jgi:hypothetical protein
MTLWDKCGLIDFVCESARDYHTSWGSKLQTLIELAEDCESDMNSRIGIVQPQRDLFFGASGDDFDTISSTMWTTRFELGASEPRKLLPATLDTTDSKRRQMQWSGARPRGGRFRPDVRRAMSIPKLVQTLGSWDVRVTLFDVAWREGLGPLAVAALLRSGL